MNPSTTSDISFWRSFFRVFIAPRQTIREILDKNPKAFFWPLLTAIILTSDDDPRLAIYLTNKMSSSSAIILSAVAEAALTFAAFWFLAWIIYVSGKAMGGTGSLANIQTAYLWSAPPYILAAFFGALGNSSIWLNLSMGETNKAVLDALPYSFTQVLALAAQVVLLIWALVLQVVAIAEAHQISKWKAFWAGTAQLLVIFGVILVLGILIVAYLCFWQH